MTQPERMIQVLVVDDDPDTVSILVRYLHREGFAAMEARSGSECLRLANSNSVDLILLDVMMPDMDGFAVCRALKSNTSTAEIPIIMLTARDDVDTRAEGIEAGVSDFISKPVLRRELRSRIHAQLDMLAGGRANLATLRQLDPPIRNGTRR